MRYLMAAACLGLAFWSGLWASAAILTVGPKAIYSNQISTPPHQRDSAAITNATWLLDLSLSINTNNASTHVLAAQTKQLLLAENQQNQTLLNEIDAHYQAAIKLQPSWDFAWSSYAHFMSLNAQVPNEKLLHALSMALTLGPYEQDSQAIFLSLVFKYWDSFKQSPDLLAAGQNFVAYKMKHKAKQVIQAAAKHNQLTVVEPLTYKKWHHSLIQKLKRKPKG